MRTGRRRRYTRQVALGAAVVLAVNIAAAQGSDAKDRALHEFDRGLAFANDSDFESAIVAFEAAYRASPHYSVLYNLAQAYASVGKHVQAIDALERYLAEGGTLIDGARRAQVEGLLAREKQRIGHVEVDLSHPGADVFVDGKAVAPAEALKPIGLSSGVHVITASAPGYRSAVVSVDVEAGKTASARLELVPESDTTLGSLVVLPARPPPMVAVDGQPYAGGPLKIGAHRVRVDRTGFRTWEHTVEIEAGSNNLVQVDLEPNRPPPEVGSGTQRTWAIATGIGGVTFVGAATVTYAWNAGRFDDWQAERERVDSELAKGNAGADVLNKNQELAVRAAEIQRVDDIALGMAIAGAALLVTSGVLWLTGASGSSP